jgi:ribosomal protein S18 acetylase RimI-like enzyme
VTGVRHKAGPTAAVRPAALTDADAVYRLLLDFATSHRPERTVFDGVTFPGVLRAANAGGAEFLLVDRESAEQESAEQESAERESAERESSVVGYALAVRMPTLFAGGMVLELLELTVAPPLRGQGLGTLLVHAVLERAARAGDVEVTVPTRRAADFYRRLGFRETATYLKRQPPSVS